MRSSTWLSFGFALMLPAVGVVGACGPDVETVPTGGTGGTGGASTTGGTMVTTTTTTSTGGGGTGGATGGTGGTGGFMPPENDVCNGQPVAVMVDAPTPTVDGTLNGASDDLMTFCADTTPEADKPDVVYELDVPADVTATIKITATGFKPVLSLRRGDCSNRFAGDTCLVGSTTAVETKTALKPGKAWIIVDSADGNTGNFTLDIQLTTPKCGDGVVNPGEKCDPANPTSEDGCFNPGLPNGCTFGEPPPDPALAQCPGGLVTIGKGDSFQLALLNNGSGGVNNQNVVDAVDCTSPALGPENVFNLKPTGDGMLTAQIGFNENKTMLYCDEFPGDCADFIMYVRKDACNSTDPGDQLACSDFTVNPGSPFGYDELLTINIPVTANTDYWLFVDGLDEMFGAGGYFLELSLQ